MWRFSDSTVLRPVCLWNGKYVGIETIYTIVGGKQINVPEKLADLRAKKNMLCINFY